MRWFNMFKKKAGSIQLTSPAAARGPGSPRGSRKTHQKWDPGQTLRGAKVLGLLGVILLVVVGWSPARRALSAHVSQTHARALRPEQITFRNAPAWMPANFTYRLQQLLAEQASDDPMDTTGLRRVLLTLERCGWVETIDRVQRTPGGIEVAAAFRMPAAIVDQRDNYRLIDAQGVMLPGVYRPQHIARLRLPMISGVIQPAPAMHGQPWAGDQIPAALLLLHVIADQPYMAQVQAVDVSQRDVRGRLRMALVTAQGLVQWGLPPGTEQPLEPSVGVKMAWLLNVYRQTRSIDAGGRIVEVYGPAVFIHDPDPIQAMRPQGNAQADRTGYTWGR
ncbi:MAG: hypothetical protein WD042_07855 [Phycisphaeraceae bacterium]